MQRALADAEQLRRRVHALSIIVQHTAAWHRERALETGAEEGALGGVEEEPAPEPEPEAAPEPGAAPEPRAPPALLQ